MAKIRLGVNIDHVATVRNARGETYPSPLKAALLSEKFGAESITIHLREDRRHINEKDLIQIKRKLTIPLNLEIACTKEMLRISLKQKPSFVCIVPEKRQEVTTEGGLNLRYKKKLLKHLIDTLKNNGTRISLFIEPSLKDIKIAKLLGTDCIEIHTGKFSNCVNKNISYKNELNRIKKAVKFANSIGLEVHAGHGLTYKSAQILSRVKGIVEFNIGHFIVGESIFYGLKHSINKFKRIIS